MVVTSPVAVTVLLICLAVTWLLGKDELFGAVAVAGFVLGCLATAALLALLSQ